MIFNMQPTTMQSEKNPVRQAIDMKEDFLFQSREATSLAPDVVDRVTCLR